jgi:hypothetical protein
MMSRAIPETIRFQRFPQNSPRVVAEMGKSHNFSTAKPMARKISA